VRRRTQELWLLMQARIRRATCWAVLSLFLGAAANAAPLEPPSKAPYLPADDAEILQEVPSSADPAVTNMKSLRAKFDAAPHGVAAAIELAAAYVDYSRQVGDAHYAGYAEAVIAPWMAGTSPPATVLVTQATILQYRHQFDDARALLQQALKLDPRHAQAWMTVATLDMVQGDYHAAAKDCAQVSSAAGFEFGLACSGNLLSYLGQAGRGLELLRHSEHVGDKMPAAYQAWIQGLIAETAERLGDWRLAETSYLRALALLPQDNFLLVAYADFLLDRGRPQEVLKLLAAHTQSDTAFLRLALAQSALHGADVGRYTWIMAARFEALSLRGSEYFGREQVRFALQLQHDPQTALGLALRNWQVQRAPWDARVLLEAAAAAHQPQAASEVLEFLKRTKLQDPIIEPLAEELRGSRIAKE
jgi:tetratricopeptide (TPR) repeat protein